MRAFFSRRVIIALVSGLLTLAIILGVALAYNLRAPQPGGRSATAAPTRTPALTYSVTVTPTTSAPAPTHTPTTSKTTSGATTSGTTTVSAPPTTHSGRAPTSAPVASDTPTPTPAPTTLPGSPTPTTGGAVWTPPPTPTPGGPPTATPITPPTPTVTPANPVDGSTVTGSYTVTSSGTSEADATVVMDNTGNTTWQGNWIYYLDCVSNCMSASPSPIPASGITPGNSHAFALQFSPPYPFTTGTYYSTWSMSHSGTRFGAIATIKVVVTYAIPLGVDPAPGCDSSVMSWSLSGGATCTGGGLSLTANSAQEPAATLQTGPAGFNDANYYFTVDVTFSSTTTAWARLVSYFAYGSQSASSHCNAQGYDVRPDGTFRTFFIANCKETDGLWYPAPYSVGSTITITLQLGTGYYGTWVNYHGMGNGGCFFTSGYPEVTIGGTNGVTATVTNAELDTPVTPVRQANVVP